MTEKKTTLIYSEILLEQKRQNKLLQELRDAGRVLTVSK